VFCLVQWTRATPGDWEVLDLGANPRAWRETPWRPVPRLGELGGLDDLPGHPFDVVCQGVSFAGADHYAVEPLPDGGDGLVVTVWNDDPTDSPPGRRQARVWTFHPPAFDPPVGQLNTVQSQVVYAEPEVRGRLPARIERTTVRDWAEFVPPAGPVTRHGILVPDALAARHRAAQTPRGWRAWLPPG
jgi:hypothetical protein